MLRLIALSGMISAILLAFAPPTLAREASSETMVWPDLYIGAALTQAMGISQAHYDSANAFRRYNQGLGARVQLDVFVGTGLEYVLPRGMLGTSFDIPLYVGLEGFYSGPPMASPTEGRLRAVPVDLSATGQSMGEWGAVFFEEDIDASFTYGALYGLSVIVGFRPHQDYLVYLRGGASRRDSEGKDLSAAGNLRSYNALSGLNYGLGLETVLTRSTLLRLEWRRSEDESITSEIGNDSQTRRLLLGEYRLGLVYRPHGVELGAPQRHAGFYAGGGVSAESSLLQAASYAEDDNRAFHGVFLADVGSEAESINLFAGYGFAVGGLYVGGEMGYATSRLAPTASQVDGVGGYSWLRYKFREHLLVSGQMGVAVGPSLVYAHAGLGRSSLDIDFFTHADGTGSGNFPDAAQWEGLAGARETLDGIAYGLGLRIMLGRHFFLRGQVAHILYDDWRRSIVARFDAEDAMDSSRVIERAIETDTEKIERMEYGFSLGYLF